MDQIASILWYKQSKTTKRYFYEQTKFQPRL